MLLSDVAVVQGQREVGLFVRHGGGYELRVPLGLVDLSAREALALLFKVFVVFRRSQPSMRHLHAHDGVEERSGGNSLDGRGDVSFCDALALDELFERVDPRTVLSLCDRPSRMDHEIPKRIDLHLHLALFDADGAGYFEQVPTVRRMVKYGTAEIVGLYCVLALDFYESFLEVDPRCGLGIFAAEAEGLASDFRLRHLTPQDSLFQADHAANERSRERFRELLHRIDRASPFRNFQYRAIHGALHRYLHAGLSPDRPSGQIWGVSDFWAVWESVCLCHAISQEKAAHGLPSVWTCDYDHLPYGLTSQRVLQEWDQHRSRVFARNDISRRPDLVLKGHGSWTIVDFKYYLQIHPRRPKWAEDAPLAKAERDFLNLEIYGLLLHAYLAAIQDLARDDIALEFWLPGESHAVDSMTCTPAWNPPLSIRRLEMRSALEDYGQMYGD